RDAVKDEAGVFRRSEVLGPHCRELADEGGYRHVFVGIGNFEKDLLGALSQPLGPAVWGVVVFVFVVLFFGFAVVTRAQAWLAKGRFVRVEQEIERVVAFDLGAVMEKAVRDSGCVGGAARQRAERLGDAERGVVVMAVAR